MNQISRVENPFWTRANRHLPHCGYAYEAHGQQKYRDAAQRVAGWYVANARPG